MTNPKERICSCGHTYSEHEYEEVRIEGEWTECYQCTQCDCEDFNQRIAEDLEQQFTGFNPRTTL